MNRSQMLVLVLGVAAAILWGQQKNHKTPRIYSPEISVIAHAPGAEISLPHEDTSAIQEAVVVALPEPTTQIAIAAALPKDVSEVKANEPPKIRTLLSLIYGRDIRRKVLSIEDGRDDQEWRQLVFVEGGNRYTLFYSWSNKFADLNFLTIWVRRNGTKGNKNLDVFGDTYLDGEVDEGLLAMSDKRFYSVSHPGSASGPEYRGYWQKRYDAAIAAALHHLK